ncbi:DUF4270 family protein [Marinigracilibium pacificum]|uniref:DUF4270 domain-containing protein n=1 Tax=Marinigracilibium pacificum TaxID=2729599 RepID=A0A848J2X2_9BACT|nr:DUF4270 family protein [Marinigracilibium pacificum]NMM47522.1 DUF4270 domain-containing protein [Marinigracilibium pacificum]
MRFYIIILFFIVLTSCNDSLSLGENLFSGSALVAETWDTVSVEIGTVKFDEVLTNGDSSFYAGIKDEEFTGKHTYSFYTQLSLGTTEIPDASNKLKFDSALIFLFSDGYYHGELSGSTYLNFYEVIEEISPREDYSSLYNIDTFSTNPVQIGRVKLSYPTEFDSTYSLRLIDEFGHSFFNKLVEEQLYESENLYGLKGELDTDVQFVLGFNSNIELRLYYSYEDDEPEADEKYISFVNSGVSKFNSIKSEYSDLVISNLKSEGDILSSSQLGDRAILHNGSGLYSIIDFPNIEMLNDDDSTLFIESAYLTIAPCWQDLEDIDEVLPELRMLPVNEKNELLSQTEVIIPLTGDDEYIGEKVYKIDVTDHVNYLMKNPTEHYSFLLKYYPTARRGYPEYLVIGDNKNNNYKSFLTINIIRLRYE